MRSTLKGEFSDIFAVLPFTWYLSYRNTENLNIFIKLYIWSKTFTLIMVNFEDNSIKLKKQNFFLWVCHSTGDKLNLSIHSQSLTNTYLQNTSMIFTSNHNCIGMRMIKINFNEMNKKIKLNCQALAMVWLLS